LLATGSLAACSEAPTLLVQLKHPLGLEPDQLKGTLTLDLLDGASGSLVDSAEVATAELGSRRRLLQGLDLVQGGSYQVRVRVTLAPGETACGGPPARVVGLSRIHAAAAPLTRIPVYVDCADRFSATGGMNAERVFHSASLMSSSGQVLVAGGSSGGWSLSEEDLKKVTLHASLERYDPVAGTFQTLTNRLTYPRMLHTATALDGDKVLLSGGVHVGTKDSQVALTSLNLMDRVEQESVLSLQQAQAPRSAHEAVLVTPELMLLAGGAWAYARALGRFYPLGTNTMELYNPARGARIKLLTEKMSEPRADFAAVSLGDGRRVLLAGGRWVKDQPSPADVVCLSGSCPCGPAPCVQRVNGFPTGRGRVMLAGTLVPCQAGGGGAVYLTGGLFSDGTQEHYLSDIFCLETQNADRGLSLVGQMRLGRGAHSATLVRGPGGTRRILVAGGVTPRGVTDSAELIPVGCMCDPISSAEITAATLTNARVGHSATRLADGTVLLAGGVLLKSAERFNPDF
jgi:hypothetical protein